MFFQKDYILRMIEMMGELVRRICSIARETDALAELDEISHKACGLPLAMLEEGETGSLESLLDDPQRFLAAELLMIDIAVQARTKEEEELLPLRMQALALYSTLQEPDYMLPGADRAASIVADTLAQLPVESLLQAAALQERAGQFASAEDAYFAAAELSEEMKPQLRAFYQRLRSASDRALLSGGLSREEIEEGLAALN